MHHLMKRNEPLYFFLRNLWQSGLGLRLRGQEDKGRQVKQARPALAESPRNLRDVELRKRKGPVQAFVIAHKIEQILSKVFQHGGRSWQRTQKSRQREWRLGCVLPQQIRNALLELLIGKELDFRFSRHSFDGIFAEIEARENQRPSAAPLARQLIAVISVRNLFAGSDQFQFFGPAEFQIEGTKLRRSREMRIPTAARAHEINSIAIVFNYRAPVFEAEFVERTCRGLLWQDNIKGIVSPAGDILPANVLILKKSERTPVCIRY